MNLIIKGIIVIRMKDLYEVYEYSTERSYLPFNVNQRVTLIADEKGSYDVSIDIIRWTLGPDICHVFLSPREDGTKERIGRLKELGWNVKLMNPKN